MAAVLQFRRKSAPAGWANDELAEFYRIVDVMGRAGLSITVDVGVSDEDEPWVAFVREDNGDVLAHIARIDGWVVAVSAASPEVVRAQTLKEVVRRIVDTHPLVLLPAHRPGSHIHIHPCAVLAAVITAAYLLAEGVQSEANAREFALSRSANESAPEDARSSEDGANVHGPAADGARHPDGHAVDVPALAAALAQAASGGAPSKVAPHPNPLRGALTSISDFLRGVGDIAQPVTINSTAANATIAAVVALAMTGDDSAANVAHLSATEAQQAAAAIAAAAFGLTGAETSEAKAGTASQHVVGLEVGVADGEAGGDSIRGGDHLVAIDRIAAETQAVARDRASLDPAPSDPSSQLMAQLMAKPLDGAIKVVVDGAVQQHSAAVVIDAAPEHAIRPAVSESISTAPSTVAGVAGNVAAKVEYGTNLINLSAARASESAADHGAYSNHATDVAVLRLSDISKSALSALRISEALITALSDATLTSAAIRLVESDGSSLIAGGDSVKSSLTSTSTAIDIATGTTKVGLDSVSADLSVVSEKSLSSSAAVVAMSGPAVSQVSSTSSSVSANVASTNVAPAGSGGGASTVTTATTAVASSTTQGDTAHPTSAYDIITGILSFAFGEHPIFAATSAARADITGDLLRYGVSPTTPRVLIFSSETVTVPVFELTPGVVLVDGHEIAAQHRAANSLNVSNATKVIYLPDGGTINLIGVVDLSIPV